MKEEKQRISIAEAIGAVRGSALGYSHGQGNEFYIADSDGDFHDLNDWSKRYRCLRLYDPLNDLNAMHEAEKVIKGTPYWKTYETMLAQIVSGDNGMFHITSAQRAEAFLRTIGKWEETE